MSDIAHFLKGTVSSHLSLLWTGCEWHCIGCQRQAHYIFSCYGQDVSDVAQFVEGNLIRSFPMTTGSEWQPISKVSHLIRACPMTNSLWVMLHIFWKALSSYDKQGVSNIAHFVNGSLNNTYMTNSLWVTLHIFWKVSWHFFYDKQFVSNIAHLWTLSHIFSYDQ